MIQNATASDLEKELDTAVENDLAEARREPVMPHIPRAVERSPHQQLEAFMASSAKMLELQRRQLIQSESDYQMERLRLLNDYHVRIQTLQNECADAVRLLDIRHKNDLADAQNILDRLAAMRAV